MGEMTEREFKKASGSVGYFERELEWITLEAINQDAKAERATTDAQAAREAASAARAAAVDAQARLDEARASIVNVTIVSSDESTAPPSVGIGAFDASIVTDGDAPALDVLPEGA